MVRGKSDDHLVAVSELEEGVEEDADGAIQPKDLVVNLAGIRTIGVADVVGR